MRSQVAHDFDLGLSFHLRYEVRVDDMVRQGKKQGLQSWALGIMNQMSIVLSVLALRGHSREASLKDEVSEMPYV